MATREDLQFIDLDDFTPGIYSDFMSAGGAQAAPNGAAQIEGTWGCYAAPGGGLVPMPKLEGPPRTLSMTGTFTGNGRMPSDRRQVAILDVLNLPGVRPPIFIDYDTTGPDYRINTHYTGISDFFLCVTQRYYDSGNASSFKRQWALYQDQIHFIGDTAEEILPWGGNQTGAWRDFGFGSLELGRAHGIDSLLPGQPHFKIAIGGRVNTGATEVYNGIYIYPGGSDYEPTEYASDIGSPYVIAHQGRTIWTDLSTFDGWLLPTIDNIQGAVHTMDVDQKAALQVSETLYWMHRNSITVENSQGTVFVEENPTGYGAWASMNANELFLVKQAGGAVLINGSLNNPTVNRLPGVESTMGITCKGIVTPLGFVYGSRSGVWIWNGSDTAECISPQLDGYFWENPATVNWHPAQPVGRFGYHHPFIFAPNNWVYDVRTGGWFRLTAPTEPIYSFYNHSIQGRIYASPATISVADPATNPTLPYLYSYKLDTFRSSWSWTSQPLQKSKSRRIDFREVDVIVQGAGQLTVTLTGLEGAQASVSFTFNSPDRPIALHETLKLAAHDVVVQITADGGVGDAPRLYRLSLGHRAAQSATATGSKA